MHTYVCSVSRSTRHIAVADLISQVYGSECVCNNQQFRWPLFPVNCERSTISRRLIDRYVSRKDKSSGLLSSSSWKRRVPRPARGYRTGKAIIVYDF